MGEVSVKYGPRDGAAGRRETSMLSSNRRSERDASRLLRRLGGQAERAWRRRSAYSPSCAFSAHATVTRESPRRYRSYLRA
eukprot:4871630-Pyramimonas_sp.AAC.1